MFLADYSITFMPFVHSFLPSVLCIILPAWAHVRDDAKPEIDWMIVGYVEGSKTDITTLAKGGGGVDHCAAALPMNRPVFGGCRLESNGRFVTFFYTGGETTPVMLRGRASMHKNGERVSYSKELPSLRQCLHYGHASFSILTVLDSCTKQEYSTPWKAATVT